MYAFKQMNYGQAHNSNLGLWVIQTPTNNCQFASLSNTESILALSDEKEIIAYFKDAKRVANQNMFLLDVHNNGRNTGKIEGIFSGDNIVLKTPYTSTNNSEMILYLVKTVVLDNL